MMLYIIVIVIVLFLFIRLLKYYTNVEEMSESNPHKQPSITIVVARYNENVDWLDTDPFKNMNIIIYEKGPYHIKNKSEHTQSISLPNVGRCDHTFLHHIIENYNNLSDVTVFLPGSATMDHKLINLDRIKHAIKKYNETADISHIYKTQQEMCYNVPNDELELFELDNWTASHSDNKNINNESALQLSPIRPFGAWFKENLPHLTLKPCVWYSGIFIATKNQIHKHPIEVYQRLIKYVDNHSNPEAGHYLERTWANLFFL